MNAPVVPLYSSTEAVLLLLTNRSPLGPNVRPSAPLRPPPLAKVPTNAPVVRYSSTELTTSPALVVVVLLTNRSPLGPNVKLRGLLRPPPEKVPANAPVASLYTTTELVPSLAT
jgi:hypothetical protein